MLLSTTPLAEKSYSDWKRNKKCSENPKREKSDYFRLEGSLLYKKSEHIGKRKKLLHQTHDDSNLSCLVV